MTKVQIKRLDKGVALPKTAYSGDAGFDLEAAVDCVLAPGERAMVSTGLAVAIPEGFAGLVIPRSGLAWHHGLSLVNTPGLIDSHYRGELRVIAINHDLGEPIQIKRGDRIAQLVIVALPAIEFAEVAELDDTDRGAQGFGSSGLAGQKPEATAENQEKRT
ncbi:MAG: dUTP diphosphatase [Coriobacteriia bacterium]|nr:dUTP diphosphatase [Coriobacteriia bacterium]